MITKQIISTISGFSLLLILSIVLGALISCAGEDAGPPEDVIKEAKVRTESIIDRVRLADTTITGEPELIEEYWDKENKTYVMKYYIETIHGAAVTDSPTVQITREGKTWKYTFQFDKPYESIIEVKQENQ